VKRVIFLVDMNAFFISCEMARNPELKGKPAAVAGNPKKRAGIILAANYEARRYGVKTTMLISDAKKLCPSIAFVPSDHSYYENMSDKVMNILSSYTLVMQQNSIDEAWLDMTGCGGLFGSPTEAAEKIMKEILDKLDLWCSIGISYNKFLAKMASDMKKPLGITEINKEDMEKKLWPLSVGDMFGVGKKTEKKLNSMGIYTVGDIAKYDKLLLIKSLGKYGEDIHNQANGIDNSKVETNVQVENKSIGRSITLPNDTLDIEYIKGILYKLSEEVGSEARKYGNKGRTVSITIKYNDFQTITRQKSIPSTYLTKDIYETGANLLYENWNPKTNRPIRLIGISLSNILEKDERQITIFDIGNFNVDDDYGDNNKNKQEAIEKTIDSLREKFGKEKIKMGREV